MRRWHHPYGRKWRGTKKPLDESESGESKSWLKAQHSENEDHGIWSHHFMGNRWGKQTLFLGAPKSLQMVTVAMKLKDAYSLKEKLWPTSVQFSSVSQSCPTLCDPVNCSTPGLPVHHQLPEFTQTHIHPAIASSVVPFSSCPQSLAASESFPMSQLFTWGGQSTGVSALLSVLPKKSQGWSPSEWTGWISLQSSQESSPTPQFKSIHSLALSLLHSPTLTSIHDHRKNHSLD